MPPKRRVADLPPEILRDIMVPFLSTQNVRLPPRSANCGQFARSLLEIPHFDWSQLASDEKMFKAFKSSVKRSLDVFVEQYDALKLFNGEYIYDTTHFSLEEKKDIVVYDWLGPIEISNNLKVLIDRVLIGRKEIKSIFFHKNTRGMSDEGLPRSFQYEIRKRRVQHLVSHCQAIAMLKRKLRQMLDIYPQFLDLVDRYRLRNDVVLFRVRAKELGIAPFRYLMASNSSVRQELDRLIPRSARVRRDLEHDLHHFNTRMLQHIVFDF
jgi:hypothetical protein